MMSQRLIIFGLIACLLAISACTSSHGPNPYQLVEDEKTGYAYGATKSGEFIADPAMFRNNKLKLRIRNTTGDPALDIYAFRQKLEQAYSNLGYEITDGRDFGILLDVNVKYFGQITDTLSQEYTFLTSAAGATVGSIGGLQSGDSADTIIGVSAGSIMGAAVGEILRNFITEETFIIISSITLATVMPEHIGDESVIQFTTGKKIKQKKTNFKGFRSRDSINLAVYAGGTMAEKGDIIDEVRERHLRILKDII